MRQTARHEERTRWSRSLLPVPWLEAVALAPAFGVAVLVAGGALAFRLGTGGSGSRWWAAALAAAAGWAPLALHRRSPGTRRGDAGGPEKPVR